MKYRSFAFAFVTALACGQNNMLPQQATSNHILVTFAQGNTLGTAGSPQPINFNPSNAYTVNLQMVDGDGNPVTYDAPDVPPFVRITTKPGTVYTVNAGQDGRNVQLDQNGSAQNVAVTIVAAFGQTRIWAQDIGYVPVSDLTRQPPPGCADGIDNDGDGLVDYPADPGCFSPNDDDETSGTGATGVSDVIYYARPRIADVRGATTTSGTGTPFPNEQVDIDTGYDLQNNVFKWDTVVTGLSSDGFFATDLQDATNDPQKGLQYGSAFAYTFSAPTKIGVCDRLRVLEATSSDFFGYTELNFPTWAVEYWDPQQRPCLVPDATVIGVADWSNAGLMFKNESGLVRLATDATKNVALHVGGHMGAGRPTSTTGYTPAQDASGNWLTNCDLNGDGKVNFSDPNEGACANACEADVECTEFSSFLSQGGFTIVVQDTTTASNVAKAQGEATAATSFDPVVNAGKPLTSFTGMLRYFSGGSQFTIQARCDDDVRFKSGDQPLDSAHACVNQNGNNPEQQ
jgi:hypothetical protein